MTTVPGTYFTEEQLEADLKADKVSDMGFDGYIRINHNGSVYNMRKKYDKALAWHILAARENDSYAQYNIGNLYYNGFGVPQNYLCALKWYLKAVEGNKYQNTSNNIGWLFEYGSGVPLDKHKALEWYYHVENKTLINRLEGQGYHRSAAVMEKSLEQSIKETEVILDAEKKKLEQKQDKTQQEMEALVDLNITYELVDGGKEAWKDAPILFADDKQRYTKPEDEILELKKEIQLLKSERSAFESQAKQLQALKQEESNFQLEIKEKDRQIALLRDDFQLLQVKNATFQQQTNTNDSKIVSLQKENQELQLKTNSLEQQVREKDNEIELNNLKMESALDKKKEKIKKLQKEMKRLKQQQQQQQQTLSSREARTSSNTTVPEATASNTGINEDNPNNDFNYDTECSTEYSSSDDTSSEGGDHTNDLNYDSDV